MGKISIRKSIFAGLVIVILLSFFTAPAAAEKPERLVMGFFHEETDETSEMLKLRITDAVGRMGIEVVFQYAPEKRISDMADSGLIDGELARTYEHAQAHENLLRVEVPLIYLSFVFLFGEDVPPVAGWDDLAGTSLRIGYVRGMEYPRMNLAARIPPDQVFPVNSEYQGLMMLQSGRVDLFILTEVELDILSTLPEFADLSFAEARILPAVPIHIYLHKRHGGIIPELEEILLEMKAEGFLTN